MIVVFIIVVVVVVIIIIMGSRHDQVHGLLHLGLLPRPAVVGPPGSPGGCELIICMCWV